MGQEKEEWDSEKKRWSKAPSKCLLARRVKIRDNSATEWTSEAPLEEQLLLLKVSLAAGTDSPSLTSAPLFFLTYLDSLFHRYMLTWGNLEWEWESLGRGCVVGWHGQIKCETRSLLPLSPHAHLTWCQRGLHHCANMAFLQGQWGGQEGIICALKSRIARQVGTFTKPSTSLEISLGIGHGFLVEVWGSRAQRDHLAHSHIPAQQNYANISFFADGCLLCP